MNTDDTKQVGFECKKAIPLFYTPDHLVKYLQMSVAVLFLFLLLITCSF